MKNSKLDLRSGVMVIERRALDMGAKPATVTDKLLIEPAHTADIAVTAILPLLRRRPVVS
jgi:hypothetical protein